MPPRDLITARFPDLKQGYESYFTRASDPSGGLGFWIRYTVHRAPDRSPTGSLWFTCFDADAPAPTAAKTTLPHPSRDEQTWVRIGESTAGPRRVRGRIGIDSGVEASWDLSFSGAELFEHLPSSWMYDAPLPRTKPVSLHPSACLSGTLTVGGRDVEVDDWPGMVGHNWGSEHAERWIWLHCSGFREDRDAWLDVVMARLKLGSWTTPWTGFGALHLDGRRHRLGGLSRVRSTRVEEHPDRFSFYLAGSGLQVSGRGSAPASRFVGWEYADPGGTQHDVVHCSIADLELVVEGDGEPRRMLNAAGTAAYELGMREHDLGVEIQPYPDG